LSLQVEVVGVSWLPVEPGFRNTGQAVCTDSTVSCAPQVFSASEPVEQAV
jgi:hypothetical protein